MAKVMIVDDSPTDIVSLRAMLQRAGHAVIEVTSGADAIERVKIDKPDCVIMDVVMPGVNGFQATRTLAKDPATAGIPVVVVSSKNQETDRLWALRQGAREYVTKPVKESELLAKISVVLSR
jgi:twitching motility two-component system response regulator PilH